MSEFLKLEQTGTKNSEKSAALTSTWRDSRASLLDAGTTMRVLMSVLLPHWLKTCIMMIDVVLGQTQ